jgi:hypothetical protein
LEAAGVVDEMKRTAKAGSKWSTRLMFGVESRWSEKT